MRKHNYVCGYLGERQVIYGTDDGVATRKNWTDPMTLFQAKQHTKRINEKWNLKGNERMFIFELKLVK